MVAKILTVGHACLDIVHYVSRIPGPNAKVSSENTVIQVGGNAANVAVASCEMGADASLCAVLGSEDHPFTRILVSLLKAQRVGLESCRFDPTEPCPSSTIMVLADGERSIISSQCRAIRTAVALPASIGDFSVVMGDAYRLPMVRQVFMMARSQGIPTMLDVDGPVDDIGQIPSADHVWFSREAWMRQRISLPDLQKRLGGVVGITDGDRPLSWIEDDGVVRYHTPASVKAINTLGAGDVFRARLAIEISKGLPVSRAIPLACESAAEHITGKQLSVAA